MRKQIGQFIVFIFRTFTQTYIWKRMIETQKSNLKGGGRKIRAA